MAFEDRDSIKAPVIQISDFKLELENISGDSVFCLKAPGTDRYILKYTDGDSDNPEVRLTVGQGTDSVNFDTNSLRLKGTPIDTLWNTSITNSANEILSTVRELIPADADLSAINSTITELGTRVSSVETGLTTERTARESADNTLQQKYSDLASAWEGDSYRLLNSSIPNTSFNDIIGIFIPYASLKNKISAIEAITLTEVTASSSFWVSVYSTSQSGVPSTEASYSLVTQSKTPVDIISGSSTQAIFKNRIIVPTVETSGGLLLVFHSRTEDVVTSSIEWLISDPSAAVKLNMSAFKYNLSTNDWTKSDGIGLLQTQTSESSSTYSFSQAAIPSLTVYITGHINNLDIHMPWNSVKTYINAQINTTPSISDIKELISTELQTAGTQSYINYLIDQKLNNSN